MAAANVKGKNRSNWWISAMAGSDRSASAGAARVAAACLEPCYAGLIWLRNRMFDSGFRSAGRAGRPVISVGNITTGGTGKTPFVLELARMLGRHGVEAGVLLRGYRGGPGGESDEAELYRLELGADHVEARPDRLAGAAALLGRQPAIGALLLDDGFQHRRMHRDLDLLLVDATNPLGYGRVLPRGMLRESPRGMQRADAVVITRADVAGAEQLDRTRKIIERYHGRPAIAECAHRWLGIVNEAGAPVDAAGRRVLAFCAIGNPDAFFIQARGFARLAASQAMEDHQNYSAQDMTRLSKDGMSVDAEALLTTEKDWVKVRRVLESTGPRLPVWHAKINIEFLAGRQALETLILGALKKGRADKAQSP